MKDKDRDEFKKWLRLGYETYGSAGASAIADAMGVTLDGATDRVVRPTEDTIRRKATGSTTTAGSDTLASSTQPSLPDDQFRYGSPPPTKRPPLSCPPAPPRGDRKWKAYDGNPAWFHCGFEGYIENREPSPSWPAGECFYDEFGRLVDRAHPYAGCAGTPNQYQADDPRHVWPDEGGIVERGWGGFWESQRHLADEVRDFLRGQPRPDLRDVRPFRAPLPQWAD